MDNTTYILSSEDMDRIERNVNKLYINNTLEKSIRAYCKLNDIEDINEFANRCAMQGFNIIKFGNSPKDNINRENNGIKDIKEDELKPKKKRTIENKVEEIKEKKDDIPTKEIEKKTVTRKIRVIKK